MDKGQVGVNEISRRYGIPSRTLRRRYANKSCEKLTLRKHPTLDFDNEKRFVAHIQKLAKAGFPTTRQDVRRLAFEFAENWVWKILLSKRHVWLVSTGSNHFLNDTQNSVFARQKVCLLQGLKD
ncbi:hypothetical protein HHI36_010193 [Cryptolaemus montrouzieri]|uniref:HTH psq-type domain-containing protein n=1 Tax=Cryptolaemus montrouzieri TaxID=559131 RepID=A0ABD2MI14_9CUCU